MRGLIALCLILYTNSAWSLSPEEANKFVDKYDTAQKKILGFINCVTRVLTGEDAVTPTETKDSRGLGSSERPSNLEGCFNLVGFKMGAGFSKVTALFSKGESAPSSLNVKDLDQATQAVREELIKERTGQGSQAAAPSQPPVENLIAKDRTSPIADPVKVRPTNPIRAPASQVPPGKVKTAW